MRDIIFTEELPSMEYIKRVTGKTQIVLHHTVSALGKYIDDWFKSDKGKSKVAVAYVVDKDGSIYQLFDPIYWAWHIGGGASRKNNEESIAIEVVNEGQLFKRSDGSFYWWIDNDYPEGRFEYEGIATVLAKEFRGFLNFASYTDEQVDSTHDLIKFLFDKFPNIPRRFINTFDYNRNTLSYKGVVMHVNLRETGKWDLSPAWDLNKTSNIIFQSGTYPNNRPVDLSYLKSGLSGIKMEPLIEENISITDEAAKPPDLGISVGDTVIGDDVVNPVADIESPSSLVSSKKKNNKKPLWSKF